ncbi:MAG: type VI secretion system tip protein VgrG [Bacteroidota bacterium]
MPNKRIIPTPQSADLVTHSLKVNGKELGEAYNLLSIQVSKQVNKIATAKLLIADGNASTETFEISNSADFAPGNEIEILAGYHSDEASIFKGIITCHGIQARRSKASVLRVECKDEAVKMTLGKKSTFFDEKKDTDVIKEIASNYKLDVQVDATEVTHQSLIQHHVSDWDFVLMRAEVNGLLVHSSDGSLTVSKPTVESEASLHVQYGASMYDFDAEIDARLQYKKITANSWDAAEQALVTAEAADPKLTEAGNISASDLAAVSSPDNIDLLHPGSVADQELQAWADAALLRSRLAKIRGTVSFQGVADLKTGDTLSLGGVGERFEGPVFVSAVRHEIGNGNWVTTAQFGLSPEWFAERVSSPSSPISSLLATTGGLHVGTVTQLQDDPDSEHRILVKIPILNADAEGVWARVASLDAGDARGWFFRPEIDDEVVIGFFADDPREPVVLGMLHSSAKAAPIDASDDNHEKGLVTRSEMKMMFDDDKISFTLETPSGKLVTLDDDAGVVGLEDDNGNKILMNADGITLESAGDLILTASGDIKAEGNNVESKAKMNFKAEGSAGLEVSSSAITTVKGSLVQIN